MTGNYFIMGIKTRVYILGQTSEVIAIGYYLYPQPLKGIHNIHCLHSFAGFSLPSLYYSGHPTLVLFFIIVNITNLMFV